MPSLQEQIAELNRCIAEDERRLGTIRSELRAIEATGVRDEVAQGYAKQLAINIDAMREYCQLLIDGQDSGRQNSGQQN